MPDARNICHFYSILFHVKSENERLRKRSSVVVVGGGNAEKYIFFPPVFSIMFYVLYLFVTYLLTLPRICQGARGLHLLNIVLN
jgi:cellulose synthase/poly-beta-1,6-N-acetylglucosamine synthase-like glycosyltransferase